MKVLTLADALFTCWFMVKGKVNGIHNICLLLLIGGN